VTVLGYCITSNHTHVLARSESEGALSRWMQQVEGEFAQSYNRRKHRSGAFWSDRYHCTMIEEGPHLWNCMVYIDLNMVRAGVVTHPVQWPWCSYGEWMGQRRRYGVVDSTECLRVLGGASLEAIGQRVTHRQQLHYTTVGENAWVVREEMPPLFRQAAFR